jgi:hypothetical protein
MITPNVDCIWVCLYKRLRMMRGELRDLLDQPGLVHHERDFRDDDPLPATLHLLRVRQSPHDHPAAARLVGLADPLHPQDVASRGEIRALDIVHQVVQRAVGIVDQMHARADNFAEVVRRHVRGHPDRYA